MATNSELMFDEIWERMRLLTGWKNYGELADYLDIKQQSVSGAKKRGTIPTDWVLQVSIGFKGSTDWLFFGEGPMRKGESAPAAAREQQTLTPSENAVQSAPYAAFDALEVVEGMGMLTRIYSSGDTTYIRAINANLMAFSDAITMKKSNEDMQAQINIMENRIADLEEKLSKLLEVRQKVVNGS